MKLTKYDTAKAALEVAKSYDEVKDIMDKAAAQAEYARRAKDTEMIEWATEIRVRAERRAGQMLAEMPKARGARLGGSSLLPPGNDPTLAEIGVSKTDSSRWQKLAAVDDEKFEAAVEAAKETAGRVTQAAILKATAPPAEPKPTTPKPEAASEEPTAAEWNEELAQINKDLMAEVEVRDKILAADDKMVAALAEIKRLQGINAILTERINGLQHETGELTKIIKSRDRRIAKLEAETAK